MRVLFISNHFPKDLHTHVGGTYRRLDMLIEALKGIAQLDMLFYVSSDTDISPAAIAQKQAELSAHWNTPIFLFLCPRTENQETLPKWKRQSGGILNYFAHGHFIKTAHPWQVSAFESCLSRQPDAIFVHRLQSMPPLMLTHQPTPPIIFDLDDIEHINFMRGIRQPPTRLRTNFYYLQLPALWWGECRAIRMAQRTFVCSEVDRMYLSKRWGLPGVVTIPNASIIPTAHSLSNERTMLLLGTYTYGPNCHAANFLIEQVFPLVQKEIPEAQLIIAGSAPENIRTYAKPPRSVEFTGFLDDLNTLYQRSRVVCCPIFSGGGTRVKLVEAAAYGKPIVATRIGAEGLEMIPDNDYLLRNTMADFADACVKLLRNDDLCDLLGHNARATAIKHYDRTNIVKLIQQEILSAIDR